MSLTLLENPNKVLHTITSNVNAAITQLPYAFRRTDFGGTANQQDGVDYVAGAQLRSTTTHIEILFESALGDVTGDWAVGETVFYESGGGFYLFVAEITEVRFFSSQTRIAFSSILFTSNDFSGNQWLNKISERPNYSAQLQIEDIDSGEILDQTFVYKPAQSGDLFVDIGAIIVTLMENQEKGSLQYRVLYRENYTGIDDSFTNDVTIQALLGERGTGQKLGSNQWVLIPKLRGLFQSLDAQEDTVLTQVEYVIKEDFAGDDATGVDLTAIYNVGDRIVITGFVTDDYNGDFVIAGKRFSGSFSRFTVGVLPTFVGNDGNGRGSLYSAGKFLTHFREVNFYEGWNVGVSFIVDLNWTTRNGSSGGITNIRERGVTINKAGTGASVSYSYNITVPRVQEHTIDGTGLEADTPFIELIILNPSTGTPTLARMVAERQNDCRNPIMIRWINSFGAFEYYQFNIGQEIVYGVTGEVTYSPPADEDVENIHRPNFRINADQTLRIVCTAENVPINNIRALHEIKTSEFVDVFLTKDGEEVIGVTVNSALSTNLNTDDHTATFIVAIDFPEDYNFFDIKRY